VPAYGQILFLLDVDNAVFAYFLPEAVRSHAEANGRAVLGNKEKSLLAFTKHAHTTAVAVAISLSVLIASFPVWWGMHLCWIDTGVENHVPRATLDFRTGFVDFVTNSRYGQEQTTHMNSDVASSWPSFIAFLICGTLEARMDSPAKWLSSVPKILFMFFWMIPVVG
jgi:hypothetical protein